MHRIKMFVTLCCHSCLVCGYWNKEQLPGFNLFEEHRRNEAFQMELDRRGLNLSVKNGLIILKFVLD